MGETLSNLLSLMLRPTARSMTAKNIWLFSCLGFSLICAQEMASHGKSVYAVSPRHLFFSSFLVV